MSTKIYNGYCCKLTDLEKVLKSVGDNLFKGYVSKGSASSFEEVKLFRLENGGCGIHVWIKDDIAYMSLYGPRQALSRVTQRIKGLVDFKYWNNTDHHPSVSFKEWDARGDVWSKILAGDGWDRRMTTQIVDETGFSDYRLCNSLLAATNKKKR